MNTNFNIQEIPEREIAVLRVTGDLDFEKRKNFSESAEQLLKTSQPKIVIDLTAITRIFSVYLGTIVDIHQRSEKEGKALSVLANKKLSELFKQANIDSIINIVIVDKQ